MSDAKRLCEAGGVVRWVAPMRWEGVDYLLVWRFDGDACRINVDDVIRPDGGYCSAAMMLGLFLTAIQMLGGYSFARLRREAPGQFAAHVCDEIQKHMRSAG